MERYHAVQKRLSAEWMAEFEAEKINITVARELADLNEKYQKQAMEHYMEHDIITQAEVRAFKKLQEDNRDIPGQFTLAQAIGRQRPPENETPVQPELQIERLFEALNKGERERVVKCDNKNGCIFNQHQIQRCQDQERTFQLSGRERGNRF